MLHDLTPERWGRISSLLDEVRTRAEADRAPLLDDACGGDTRLRAYVERLIQESDRAEREPSSCAAERFRELLSELGTPEVDPSVDGAVLAGRYRLDRVIGRGAAAVVHLAHDLVEERVVAVKLLDPRLARSVARARFAREIRMASELAHANIVPVHAEGSWEETLYYVMPYIEGESLRQRLERERVLSPMQACGIAQDVADALEHAHARGIIHRDIKPENVLLREERALVADFGVARALSTSADLEALTAAGFTVGTPAYMSPEQLSTGRVDQRSDLYALGCVLFEMLAGERPLAGQSLHTIMRRRLHEEPPDVRDYRAEVPPTVSAIVARSLARSPESRFATAGEMALALRVFRSSPV